MVGVGYELVDGVEEFVVVFRGSRRPGGVETIQLRVVYAELHLRSADVQAIEHLRLSRAGSGICRERIDGDATHNAVDLAARTRDVGLHAQRHRLVERQHLTDNEVDKRQPCIVQLRGSLPGWEGLPDNHVGVQFDHRSRGIIPAQFIQQVLVIELRVRIAGSHMNDQGRFIDDHLGAVPEAQR